MFSQFYVLSPRGDSIIFRNLRSEIHKSTAEIFFRNVRFWNGKPQEVRLSKPNHPRWHGSS